MTLKEDYLAKATKKRNKLDWNSFNFLENLLIFCTEPTRSVPKESGVYFHISSKAKDGAICIIFKIDRGNNDPLVKEKSAQLTEPIKPDYMVLYVEENTCIITIIEMKGKDEKNLRHGIEQIKRLRDILNREIKKHLPNKFKFTIQGILLAPSNAQIPLTEIVKQNFHIFPIRCSQKAELFHYVSKVNKNDEKYKNSKLPHSKDEFGFIEEILIKKALPNRMEDNFKNQNFITGKNREGIYVNYALSKDEYAVLYLEKSKKIVAIKQNEGTHEQKIKEAVKKIDINNLFTIELI